jgi:hypothetical protein
VDEMTDLRTAAQQALNSLRGYRREIGCEQPCDAERGLEAALEQHEKDVEWMKQRHANWRLQKELAEQTQERDRQQREYEESRSAALEQPEQEPVAWMDPNRGEVCRAHWLESHAPERDVDRFSCPLYTHPPRREWRGLTDAERAAVQYESFKRGLSPLEFMELHEAALKEKNHHE